MPSEEEGEEYLRWNYHDRIWRVLWDDTQLKAVETAGHWSRPVNSDGIRCRIHFLQCRHWLRIWNGFHFHQTLQLLV